MARQQISAKAFSIIVILIITLLISLNILGWLSPFESIIARALSPFQSATTSIGRTFSRWFSKPPSVRELEYISDQLAQDKVDLLLEVSQLRTALSESTLIQEQAAFLKANEYEYVIARIIGQSTDLASRIIYLNRGSSSGLKKDQPVVVDNGILIGQIISVTDTNAQARIITDRQSKIAAVIQNELNSSGLVVGERGLSARIELIPKDEPIISKQSVITSGIQTGLPRGLLIGHIEEVANEPTELFQSASLMLPRSLDRVQIVSIITNASP